MAKRINSVVKGKVGEREAMGFLIHAWRLPLGTFKRNPYEQAAGRATGDIVGLPGVHIEVKRVARPRLSTWLTQLYRDCPEGSIPVLVYRVDNDRDWQMHIRAGDLLSLHERIAEFRSAA